MVKICIHTQSILILNVCVCFQNHLSTTHVNTQELEPLTLGDTNCVGGKSEGQVYRKKIQQQQIQR